MTAVNEGYYMSVVVCITAILDQPAKKWMDVNNKIHKPRSLLVISPGDGGNTKRRQG